jgi:hypothetical protein
MLAPAERSSPDSWSGYFDVSRALAVCLSPAAPRISASRHERWLMAAGPAAVGPAMHRRDRSAAGLASQPALGVGVSVSMGSAIEPGDGHRSRGWPTR